MSASLASSAFGAATSTSFWPFSVAAETSMGPSLCASALRIKFSRTSEISSPMRTEEDIYSALELIKQDTKAFNIFSVSNADRNPYFNMVEEKKTGYYDLICKKSDYLTSQSAPIVYDLNASFYIYRKTFFENNYSTVYTPYTLIYKMPHICFDIDNQEDLEYLEYLIIKNKLKLEI